MIDGIIVLNTITNPIMGWTWTVGASMLFIVLLVASAFILYLAFTEDSFWAILLLLVLVLALFLSPLGEVEIGTYETYQVILEDNVSLNEFLDRYEILEQEGRIYTIQEKGVIDG